MLFSLLPQRGVISVSGEDRYNFLQAIISNNINKVSAHNSIYAALLTPQAKFLYEFFITAVEDSLLLETESARLDDLNRKLASLRLRAQVTLTMKPEMAVAVAFGEGVAATLDDVRRLIGRGVAYIDPRLSEGGVRLLGKQECLVKTLRGIGCREVKYATYEKFRLEYGLPDGSRDLVIGRAGLLEHGFEELNGIAFNKGCYIGQEVVTRSKYRGLVKKRLVPVVIDGPVPTPGTLLFLDNQKAGEMRSSIESIGLALIRIEFLKQAQRTGQPFRAGTTHLTPRLPVWLVLPDVPGGR